MNKTKLPNIVDETTPQFVSWLAGCQKITHDYHREHYTTQPLPVFKYDVGGRYIKITQGTSVVSFIDRTNGDVLKAASCRAPAKHARGNIFQPDNGLKCMTTYGPAYLR